MPAFLQRETPTMRLTLWLILASTLAAGCGMGSSAPRERVTFAVLAGVYMPGEGPSPVSAAMTEDAEQLLRKAVTDLNGVKNLDFVVVAGDLLARADGASIDHARAILADLKAPYYIVLGANDGPVAVTKPAVAGAASESAASPRAAATAERGLPRTDVTWAFQGHGFAGPGGYWSQDVGPDLVVVALDTCRPGKAEGHVDAPQLAWLERTLAASDGKTVIVVAYHELQSLHALDEASAWHHKLVDNAAEVRQVIEKHPNVTAVVSGNSHFAEGRVSGRTAFLASPSVSVWPLAYQLVRMSPKETEAVWVTLADEALSRRAQERLLASPELRGVFPAGEDGDTACMRLFGGKKMEIYPAAKGRP
jgi:3',5'-cyclic-AMP phosphodiesterase